MTKVFQRIGRFRAAFVASGIAAILFVAFASGGGGCYNPKVASGTLHCAALPGKQCPDGFTCLSGLCEEGEGGNRATGGAAAGGTGAGGGAGTVGGTGGTCANAIAPLCPTSSAAAAGCDPVCQRGCGCGLRCNLGATGVGCGAVSGARQLGTVCQPKADDCAPGSVCLPETCGTGLGRCYKFCRETSDCPGGIVCGIPVRLPDGSLSGLRACNTSDQTPACDPIGQTGCPDAALACYATGQSTKCDCPDPGDRHEGQSCAFYTDCAPGLTCLTTGGIALCRKTCKVNTDCTGGATCAASGAFGFCSS